MNHNPYESPAPVPEDARTNIKTIVFPPAILLLSIPTLVWEGYAVLITIFDALLLIQEFGVLQGLLQSAPFMVFALTIFASHWVVLVGVIKMLQLRGYRMAVTAAILSITPITSPGYLLGIPFGIWALVALSTTRVSKAFDEGSG